MRLGSVSRSSHGTLPPNLKQPASLQSTPFGSAPSVPVKRHLKSPAGKAHQKLERASYISTPSKELHKIYVEEEENRKEECVKGRTCPDPDAVHSNRHSPQRSNGDIYRHEFLVLPTDAWVSRLVIPTDIQLTIGKR